MDHARQRVVEVSACSDAMCSFRVRVLAPTVLLSPAWSTATRTHAPNAPMDACGPSVRVGKRPRAMTSTLTTTFCATLLAASVLSAPCPTAQTALIPTSALLLLVCLLLFSPSASLTFLFTVCAVDCVVTPWINVGGCSVTCDVGVQAQLRSILFHSSGSGTPCPELQRTVPCIAPTTCPSCPASRPYNACPRTCISTCDDPGLVS